MSIRALVTVLNSPESVNYNQQKVEGIVDVTAKITLRGGGRYVWGDATVRAGTLSQTGPLEFGALKRNVGLAGATIRPWQKLSLNVDYEGAITDQYFFRIGLYNYNQGELLDRKSTRLNSSHT